MQQSAPVSHIYDYLIIQVTPQAYQKDFEHRIFIAEECEEEEQEPLEILKVAKQTQFPQLKVVAD
jgi:hypothetical protein